VVGGLCFALLGFMPVNANSKPPSWETGIAMHAMDAAVERHAPKATNPLSPTEDNINQGMVLYTMNCAVCHGSPAKKDNLLGHSFYPPAPQFLEDPADMPDNENFWIIQNGVRYTGMPGWKGTLTDEQTWKIVTFLDNMNSLPPAVKAKWEGGQ
ncbi:MAG TPA: c-type cytochrome, partial [Terriglobales bacterium]|nr:c-type cytochrome [Terriglobales bacterium]